MKGLGALVALLVITVLAAAYCALFVRVFVFLAGVAR